MSGKVFTPEELLNYAGTANQTNPSGLIYISVRGTVYDVTAGADFYGPDSGYHAFAGKILQIVIAASNLHPDPKGLISEGFLSENLKEHSSVVVSNIFHGKRSMSELFFFLKEVH